MHKRHPGALNLYVADEDMTERRPPALAAGQARRRRPVQAHRVRHRPARPPVTVTLMFASVIIGSHPADGQDVPARLLLLICALDLRTEIHAYDLKGTGDLPRCARSRTATGPATSPKTWTT